MSRRRCTISVVSGHSKWSTIKRQKGASDAKRGTIFTKLSNAITVAVRQGGAPDVETNFKLRLAVEKARYANMPKQNIARAINRGTGQGQETTLSETIFEGFGPEGLAVIVEAITDNSTRTAASLRNAFSKHGGTLASPGAVSYLFSRVGEIEIDKFNKDNKSIKLDDVFEKAAAAGAQDVEENEDTYSVYTKIADLHAIKEKLAAAHVPIISAELVYRPNKETVVKTVDPVKMEKMTNFLAAIDDLPDAQNVYSNLD